MMPPSSPDDSNSMALMEESGQTDAERRRLRQAQRSLQKSIIENGEAMENPTDETFGKIRGENNDLFEKVKYTREAVLDGENLDLIASHAAKQVDSLVQVPRYDAVRFTQKLCQKCTSRQGNSAAFFDWAMLGRETGTCFNAVPSRVQFMAGPLGADFSPKERKQRAKRQKVESDSEAEEERPEEVKNQETNADQLSAVERNIEVVRKTLKKQSKRAYDKAFAEISALPEDEQPAAKKKARETATESCAIHYMFNPKSFTQTVENVFHFSFLVKKGEAKICVRDNTPKVAAIPKKQHQTVRPSKQAVVSLTMRDWRKLCKAYHVTKSHIAHRTGSKHKHTARKRSTPDSDEGEPSSP